MGNWIQHDGRGIPQQLNRQGLFVTVRWDTTSGNQRYASAEAMKDVLWSSNPGWTWTWRRPWWNKFRLTRVTNVAGWAAIEAFRIENDGSSKAERELEKIVNDPKSAEITAPEGPVRQKVN